MTNTWRILLAACLALPPAFFPFEAEAQLGTPAAQPSSAPANKGDGKAKPDAPKGPTIITASEGTTFDQKANMATFAGSVKVVDPQFTLECDKLTVFMRGDDKTGAKGKGSPSPTPISTPAAAKSGKGSKDEGPQEGGGIDHGIAEGNVRFRQDKASESGGPPQVNIGKCKRAIFNNRSGEVTMYGLPQLQQGISTHIATSEGTVMKLDNAGHLKTDGPSRTVIQDAPDPTPAPKPGVSSELSPGLNPSSTPRSSLLPLGGF